MALKTVLIVEDDKSIRYLLKETMEQDEFLTVEATTIRRTLEILNQHKVNLILLDLTLPDGCAVDYIDKIRENTDVPLIVISGEKDESKRVNCFEMGADDFVSKPFNPTTLIARINAHLRRYEQHLSALENNIIEQDNVNLVFHGWELDTDKYQLFDENGQSANLTSAEYKLILFLLEKANKVVKRIELCEAMQQDNYIPSERAIDVKIVRLRKKINDDIKDPKIIKTVRGVGYMLDCK